MAPSPWGSAPNCCDRAADDSESADPEQQEFSPQPLGTGRYRLSPHCLNIPGGLRFVSSLERCRLDAPLRGSEFSEPVHETIDGLMASVLLDETLLRCR